MKLEHLREKGYYISILGMVNISDIISPLYSNYPLARTATEGTCIPLKFSIILHRKGTLVLRPIVFKPFRQAINIHSPRIMCKCRIAISTLRAVAKVLMLVCNVFEPEFENVSGWNSL